MVNIVKKIKRKWKEAAKKERKRRKSGKPLLTSERAKRLKSIQPAIGGLSMVAKKSLGAAIRANIRPSLKLVKTVKTIAGRAKIAKRIKEVQPILKGRKQATELIRKGMSVGLRRREISKTVQTAAGRKKIAKRIVELTKKVKKRK